MRRKTSLVLTIIAGVGFGCGTPEPSVGHAVLAPHAVVLDDAGLLALDSVGPDGLIRFSSSSPVLESVGQGSVLIVGIGARTPHGALVFVNDAIRTGNGWELQTRPARIGEAFEELQIGLHTTLSATARLPAAGPGNGGLSFTFNLGTSDNNGSVSLDGALSVEPTMSLDLDLDIVAFKLEQLSLTFGAKETLVTTFTARGEASISKSVTLGAFEFAPIILTIPTPAGALPVILTPRAVVRAGFEATVRGEIEAGVTQQAAFTTGLGYRNGSFGGSSTSTSSFDVDQPVFGAAVNAKATAGPRLEVLLYGAVGPYTQVEGYVELGANAAGPESPIGPPACAMGTVDAGLTAKAGVALLADYETTLFDKNYPLASFDSCSNDPNAPRPAPTWARSFGREGSTGERARALVELSDGTYVVAGDSDLFGTVTGYAASIWVIRLDKLGNPMWQRAFQRVGSLGTAVGLQEVPRGVIVATSRGLFEIDTGGNLSWARSFGDGPLELASIAATGNGHLIAAGRRGSPPSAWAMEVDDHGKVVWSRRFAGSDFARVRATNDGGAILVGANDSNDGDAYLVKLDSAGRVTWQRSLDDRYDSSAGQDPNAVILSGIDRGNDVVELPQGGYEVVGESYGRYPIPQPEQQGFFVPWQVRLDPSGAITSSTVLRAPASALYDSAYAVAVRPNGSTLVLGRRAQLSSDLLANEDLLLIDGGTFSVLDGSGNDALYTAPGAERSMPLHVTRDGGAVLAATSTSFAGRDQFWLVKLSRTGSIKTPYFARLDGASYSTDQALSAELSAEPVEAPVTSEDITASIGTEVTDMTSQIQAP